MLPGRPVPLLLNRAGGEVNGQADRFARGEFEDVRVFEKLRVDLLPQRGGFSVEPNGVLPGRQSATAAVVLVGREGTVFLRIRHERERQLRARVGRGYQVDLNALAALKGIRLAVVNDLSRYPDNVSAATASRAQ